MMARSGLFSEYSRSARVAPVLVAALPTLTICWFAPSVGLAVAAIPLLFTAASGLLAEQIVRGFGKRLEVKLIDDWGGHPTVRALRFRSATNRAILQRHRAEVSQLSGAKLPAEREERRSPEAADQMYDDAVRRCLAVIGPKAISPHLFAENVQYGFRRNLLALKPFALAVVAVSALVDAAFAVETKQWVPFVFFATLLVAIAGLWIGFIRKPWVKEQAETFAQRFFLELGVWSAR